MSSKEVTGFRPGSKSWKKFMAKVYGWGGALVIVGAMFKIQHWPGASIMLIGGLGVEALIFILSAFEPLHEDPDWSLVYPELAGVDDIELHDEEILIEEKISSDKPITEQLDNMLEEAKIGPELIESLGIGLRGLSEQASKLNSISDASVATQEFATSLKTASNTVTELSQGYMNAAEAITGITANSGSEGANFGVQMQKVTQNLSELNAVYELQLQGASGYNEATGKLYSGITELLQNLNDSVDDTRKYKESMSELSSNLTALNTVYGNMLSAMGSRN